MPAAAAAAPPRGSRASKSSHALHRATSQLLRRYSTQPPSLELHLYATHFRFAHQPGLFLRTSPAWQFLSCLRDQRLPEDLRDVLQMPRVDALPFYEGCLIVEVHDHRQSSNSSQSDTAQARYPVRQLDTDYYTSSNHSTALTQPDTSTSVHRIVLWPQDGSLAADAARLYPSDPQSALQVEGRILALTQPELCLQPDTAVVEVANVSWATTMPPPVGQLEGKRRNNNSKRQLEHEGDGDSREKRMRTMDESYGRSFAPTFTRLDLIQSIKRDRDNASNASPSSTPTQAPQQPPPAQQQQQQQQKAQHPLAQTHYPPQPPSRPNSNLSVTIPPRKSNANSPQPQPQPQQQPQPVTGTKKNKAKAKASNVKAKSARGASASAASPPNGSEPGWNMPA